MTRTQRMEIMFKKLEKKLKNSEEKPMSSKEAAEYLSISISTLHKLTSGGKITYYAPTKKLIYFKMKDLRKYAFHKKKETVNEIIDKTTLMKKNSHGDM